ncbi:lipopolysaccharide biosynthesis protein [Polynucleobacter sp. HIN7]|uniref:lipopolysaccharide biosynthesis protein n=1 Tax=Polynucleobacter sp. HIN7 TaxID=3047866 RepID=UPI0025746C63|nr:oligosaccharide flippase family protein [Polynucleobacter sp. HIN7]
MGPESYGLVGLFTMLQLWFSILNVGLTPTLARETARFYGGAISVLSYLQLIKFIEIIFLGIALIGGGMLYLLSEYIAGEWLQLKELQISEVQYVLKIIALVIAIRWMCEFYRGQISGAERQVWLSTYTIIIASLRYVGIIAIFMLIGVSPSIFFNYQLCIALLELIWIRSYANSLLPTLCATEKLNLSFEVIRPITKFSLTIAFTSTVWIFITQTDKLVLSKVLQLDEYGYFTLAVLAASFIIAIGGPVSAALLPRMAKLEAEGKHFELIQVYRKATQLVTIVAGAACVTIVFNAEYLLLAWTGNEFLAAKSWKILTLYAIGNGLLVLTAFPYYLQYSKGDLRLHLINNIVFVIILVPLIIWASGNYGGVGAGYVWVGMNLFSFIALVPIVHNKFANGINKKWYLTDTLSIIALLVIAGYFLNDFMILSENRLYRIAEILLFGLTVLILGVIASSEFRLKFLYLLNFRQK